MIKQTQRKYPVTPYKSLYTVMIEDDEQPNCTFEAYLGVIDEFNPELYYEFDKYYGEFDHKISVKEELDIVNELLKPYDLSGYFEITRKYTRDYITYENLLRNFNKKDLENAKISANFALSTRDNNKKI